MPEIICPNIQKNTLIGLGSVSDKSLQLLVNFTKMGMSTEISNFRTSLLTPKVIYSLISGNLKLSDFGFVTK